MRALVIFGKSNDHPLAGLLHSERRHVWCAIQHDDHWVSYNWHKGIPIIRYEATADYDLASELAQYGWEVIESTVGDEPTVAPFILNSCVGHVKSVLGIRNWAMTPHGLWKSVKGASSPEQQRDMTDYQSELARYARAYNYPRILAMIPGFGGGGSPEPATPPPTRSDAEVQEAAVSERRRRAAASGRQSTIHTRRPDSASKDLLGE